MFSMCSELTPRAPIPDTRIPQLMQPWLILLKLYGLERKAETINQSLADREILSSKSDLALGRAAQLANR